MFNVHIISLNQSFENLAKFRFPKNKINKSIKNEYYGENRPYFRRKIFGNLEGDLLIMLYQSLESFPLRKINFVKTRTTILKAVTTLLKQEEYSAITVDEICQKAQISRGTFFNYFSTKDHIFQYYLRIFTIKIALRIKLWDVDMSFEDKLKELYAWVSEEKQYARFLDSYINVILNAGEESNEMKLIDAEFVYFFNGIEEEEYVYYNSLTMGKIFEQLCKEAQRSGEITLQKSSKELSALCTAVISAAYVADTLNKDEEHLILFNKVWKR
ncbi:MAG: TetR/AcrR family transcriptional regulator [Clostridia bacterium]|nr:TetR/AcrR family transcriptional regulator [Clostridia bacterium]